MALKHIGKSARGKASDRRSPEYRVNLTIAVADPHALWAAAAERMLVAPDMTLADLIEVIGPREDPSISDCLAMMAKPVAVAGCIMDDFWIDCLRESRPRIAVDRGAAVDKLAPSPSASPSSQLVRQTA